jgi:molybdate/tungstate transport system substrate-binding protein
MWFALLIVFLISCKNTSTDTLYIIHAGSLTLPVQEIAAAFRQEHPGVEIFTEAWGSKAGARRVAEMDVPADLFLSADYKVIENMLIPGHASWYVPFATNELSIVFTPQSRYANQIDQHNWKQILLDPEVKYGRSNPDMDPCGVRSVLAIELAAMQRGDRDLARLLLAKDRENIRPKETDLIALLQTHQLDYIFLYKSVAVQHGLSYLELPDTLNLGNFNLNHWYSNASITTIGLTPGESITERGEAMVYGLTIPHKSRNKQLAEQFAAFVLHPDKGQAILRKLGQEPVTGFENPYTGIIPQSLEKVIN